MTIGENIKRIRKEKGLTQKELGALCGMSESQIRHYELNYKTPRFETIKRISKALDIRLSEILDDDLREFSTNEINKKDILLKIESDNKTNTNYYDILRFLSSSLNDKGKQKAIDYMEDLLRIDLYSKK